MRRQLLCVAALGMAASMFCFAGRGEPQPGDVKREDRKLAKGEPQPGDDRGRGKGQPEPGDDRGRHA